MIFKLGLVFLEEQNLETWPQTLVVLIPRRMRQTPVIYEERLLSKAQLWQWNWRGCPVRGIVGRRKSSPKSWLPYQPGTRVIQVQIPTYTEIQVLVLSGVAGAEKTVIGQFVKHAIWLFFPQAFVSPTSHVVHDIAAQDTSAQSSFTISQISLCL